MPNGQFVPSIGFKIEGAIKVMRAKDSDFDSMGRVKKSVIDIIKKAKKEGK